MIAILLNTIEDVDDRAFMQELYHNFNQLMFFTVKKYASKQEDCEDIVQDGLLKLMKQIPRLRTMERDGLVGYLVVTMRHTAINYLKKEANHQAFIQSGQWEETVTPILLDTYLSQKELLSTLERIWPQLSNDEQFLLEGKYILGYHDADLADELNCETSSVRMKLTRARRHALALMQRERVGEA